MSSVDVSEGDRKGIMDRLFYVCRMIRRRAEYHIWEFGEQVDDSVYAIKLDDEIWPGQPWKAIEKKLARATPPSDSRSEGYRAYMKKCTPLDDLPLGIYVTIIDYLDFGIESLLMDFINVVPRLGARECLCVLLLSNLLLKEEWAMRYVEYLLSKSEEEIFGMYDACSYMRRVDVRISVALVDSLAKNSPHYKYDTAHCYEHGRFSISSLISSSDQWRENASKNFNVFLYGHYTELKAVARTKMSVTRTILNGDFVYKDIGYGKSSKYLAQAATRCIRFARCDCPDGLLFSGQLNEKVSHDCGQAALPKLLQFYRRAHSERDDRQTYHVCMMTAVECRRLEMINLVLEVWSSLERADTYCISTGGTCFIIDQCVRSQDDEILSLLLREGKCGVRNIPALMDISQT